MLKLFPSFFLTFLFYFGSINVSKINTQEPEKDTSTFKPSGKIWGLVFGDYYYKVHADSLGRGANNQYSKQASGTNAFAFRRIYLGYDFDISRKFTTQFLLAHEDVKDTIASLRRSVYIKLANIKWKNVFKRTDMVLGQMLTPGYAMLTEQIWAYRSIERTITDIRRNQSNDVGFAIQGRFDKKERFGYNLMVGNGRAALIENNFYKKVYADVYAKLFDKKLIIDLYSDYEPQLYLNSKTRIYNNMIKGFIAYTTERVTIGAEAFINNLYKEDRITYTNGSHKPDTVTAMAMGISLYIHGDLIKDKLRFFVRYDNYNPNLNYKANTYTNYTDLTGNINYNSFNKEQFFTGGFDYTPVKQVHIMPNVWYNDYTSMKVNVHARALMDYDMVYRITFWYIFK